MSELKLFVNKVNVAREEGIWNPLFFWTEDFLNGWLETVSLNSDMSINGWVRRPVKDGVVEDVIFFDVNSSGRKVVISEGDLRLEDLPTMKEWAQIADEVIAESIPAIVDLRNSLSDEFLKIKQNQPVVESDAINLEDIPQIS